MDSFLNPKIGGGNLIALTLMALGAGAFLGAPRLMVSASQINNLAIANTRVDQCRVVGGNDKLVLAPLLLSSWQLLNGQRVATG